MRTPCRVLAILGFLFLGTPAIASADWQLTPFLGFTFKGDTTLLDHRAGDRQGPLDLRRNPSRSSAAARSASKASCSYTPGFFQQDNPPLGEGGEPPVDIDQSRTLAIMGNVVLTTPRSWNEYGLRPFISGGIGLLQCLGGRHAGVAAGRVPTCSATTSAAAPSDSSRERVGLRFDLRYFSNLKPSDDPEVAFGRVHLSYWTGTVGVVLKY